MKKNLHNMMRKYQNGGPDFSIPVSRRDSVANMASNYIHFEGDMGSPTGGGLGHAGNPDLDPAPIKAGTTGTGIPYTHERGVAAMMDPKGKYYPKVQGKYPTALEEGYALQFQYNAGKDLSGYAMQEYLRKKEGHDKSWKWEGRNNPNLQGNTWSDMQKLPTEERRNRLADGMDWYYQNTAPKGSTWDLKTQGPHPTYDASWKYRVWQDMYKPYDIEALKTRTLSKGKYALGGKVNLLNLM